MDNPFVGEWTYRSFINDPDPGLEFNALQFGAGTLSLAEPEMGAVAGTIGGPGWSLTLSGWYGYGAPFQARFQGRGEIGGETWVYDYHGFLSPNWPNGIGQRPAIVGTIVRSAPHSDGTAEPGFVASWIAVRRD